MRTLLILWLVVSACLSWWPLSADAGQDENPRVDTSQYVGDYEVDAQNFPQALCKVATEFMLPMGIVWVKPPESLRPVHVKCQKANLDQIILSLVDTEKEYTLVFRNGVIHVLPQTSVADKSDFLNLTVDSFDARGEWVTSVSARLFRRVQEAEKPALRPPPQYETVIREETRGLGDGPAFFSLRNVTVLDVLDSLVLAADLKIWFVVYPDPPSVMPTGFKRVLSPYTLKPVADEHQPGWSLLPWGMDPLTQRIHTDWKPRTPPRASMGPSQKTGSPSQAPAVCALPSLFRFRRNGPFVTDNPSAAGKVAR